MAFTDATDDSVSDSFARLKKASQEPKEPRVELAQAATTTSDAGGGQKAEISPYMAKAKAEGEKATLEAAEAQYKRQQSEGKAAAEKARQAAIYEEYKPQLTQKFEPFQAPKETFASLAGLGVMLMAIGSMGGKKGLTSATGAMNAIAGMATGYQQGKKEEFDRQKAIFDENFRIMKENQAVIQKEFEYALKYAQRDVSGATSRLATTLKGLGLEAPATALKNGTETIQSAAEKTLGPMAKGLNEVQKKKLEIEQRIRENEAKIEEQKAGGKQSTLTKTDYDAARLRIETGDRPRTEKEAAAMYELNQQAIARGEKPYTPPVASGSRSALVQSYQDQVNLASSEIALATKRLKNLEFATSGLFQGRNTKGIFDSPLGVLANSLTKGSTQDYNNLIKTYGRNFAKIGAGGRTITDKAASDYADTFVIRDGDKPFTVLQKLAEMREQSERAVEIALASSNNQSPEMQKILKRSLNEITSSIPFTIDDVSEARAEAAKEKGRKYETFGDFMQKKLPKKFTEPSESKPIIDTSKPAITPPSVLSDQDQAAINWIKQNPLDPRAERMKVILRQKGVQVD